MSKQIKKNVEVISLVFKSVKYLHFIAEQLKSDLCKGISFSLISS